jgi:hypothetical protein
MNQPANGLTQRDKVRRDFGVMVVQRFPKRTQIINPLRPAGNDAWPFTRAWSSIIAASHPRNDAPRARPGSVPSLGRSRASAIT